MKVRSELCVRCMLEFPAWMRILKLVSECIWVYGYMANMCVCRKDYFGYKYVYIYIYGYEWESYINILVGLMANKRGCFSFIIQ
jgi:hypothetical protein